MEASSRSQTEAQLRDHVSIEIVCQDESQLVSSIKKEMENVCFTHCICRVPETTFKDHEDKYFPTLVSIGPLHHGKDPLKAKEDQKLRYLCTLLNRKPNLEASLDSCAKAIRGLEERARNCYKEKIEMSSDEFVKMMLVDGCFLIELFLKNSVKGLKRRDDPFFITNEIRFKLNCDLIMLENQMPFFILQQLFDIVPIPKQCHKSLTELALQFLRKLIPGDAQVLQEKFNQDFNHLLDLIRHCYLPTYSEVQQSSGAQQSMAGAKLLKKSGISFERATTQSLLDIKFVNGVLRIPPFRFHAYTEITFRNLLAHEHCHCDSKKYITSYAVFMKRLLQTKKDVRLLYRTRILPNGLEKRIAMLHLMGQLQVMVDEKEYYYDGLSKQVIEYGNTKLNAWWKKMMHRSSNSPLAFAGFLCAIVFLVVAFAGTLFSVLSFSLR